MATQSIPPDQARRHLCAHVWSLHREGFSYREIGVRLNISSVGQVARLLHEYRKTLDVPLAEQIRDEELATLDTWHQRLDEAAELVMAGEKPETMAALALAAERLSHSRRSALAADVPTVRKLQMLGAEGGLNPSTPKLLAWAAEWDAKQQALDDLEDRDRHDSNNKEVANGDGG